MATPDFPPGFRYERELISAPDAASPVEHIRELPFREFEFDGYAGKRRVVSFGWRYDFNEKGLRYSITFRTLREWSFR